MEHVFIKELKDVAISMVLFNYVGEGDPIPALNEAIEGYTNKLPVHQNYSEFIDMNMDNPWVRIVCVTNK
jgi:hypothetical protein